MDRWIKVSNFSTSGFLNQNWICWETADDFPALLLLFQEGEEVNAGEMQGFIPVGLFKFTFYFIWEMRSLSVFCLENYVPLKCKQEVVVRFWSDCSLSPLNCSVFPASGQSRTRGAPACKGAPVLQLQHQEVEPPIKMGAHLSAH